MNDGSMLSLPPELVGRYFVGGDAHFLPMSARELTRASEFMGWIIDTLAFEPGRAVLLVCQFEEASQFVPLEESLTTRGLILTNAEASLYDGARAVSILRRFDVAAVIGLNAALLDSMMAVEPGVQDLLRGKVVWARPCAYLRLAEMSGTELLRFVEVGPALALECGGAAGAHVDAREWRMDSEGGEVRLTSRLARSLAMQRAATGVYAPIVREVCACGLSDPRIDVSGASTPCAAARRRLNDGASAAASRRCSQNYREDCMAKRGAIAP